MIRARRPCLQKQRNALSRPLAVILIAFCAWTSVCSAGSAAGELTDSAWWTGKWAPQERYEAVVRRAQYVRARDGTRIATYLYLPEPLKPDERVPTVLIITPYASEMEYTALGKLMGGGKQVLAERFAHYGFATVLMDLPGSGASFGSKRSVFMPEAVNAGSDIVDWIIAQPWSNGNVGATGVSAVGMTANWLATARHPAVKAIAPRFTVFDIFYDVHPGGALASRFLTDIDRQVRLLDANHSAQIPATWYLRALAWTQVNGFMPMDEDHDRSLLQAAVAEHARNEYFASDIAAVVDRDDFLPGSSIAATLDTQSPFMLVDAIRQSGVAIYAFGGWFDAAFSRAQILNHKTIRNPGSRLVLGPWQHGGRFYSSPFVKDDRPSEFDQVAELVRFFDYHLRGVNTGGIADEPAVHYFTVGEERWKSAESWPPPVSEKRRYYFDVKHKLSPQPAVAETFNTYRVDYSSTTGVKSRFGKHLTGNMVRAEYPDRKEADEKLLTYTSAPLATAIEVTGHPLITLQVSSDRADGLFLVYLEDVDPQGNVLNVTDGILRGRHRKVSNDPPPYWHAGPYRTFNRADAMPITVGETMALTFDLFPVSYLFQRGHSVRIALAGADRDNFPLIPPEAPPQAPPTWRVFSGGAHASFVELPIVDATGQTATHGLH